jgi:hypothetical protein
MVRFDTLLGRLAFLELLVEESWISPWRKRSSRTLLVFMALVMSTFAVKRSSCGNEELIPED